MTILDIRLIYVSQFGAWWSFTPKQWQDWLKEMLPKIRSGEGYMLPDANMLRTRPRNVGRYEDSSRWWYPKQTWVAVVQPLDWTLEQWEELYGEYCGLRHQHRNR